MAFLVRMWVGTWIFPACLFSLFWFACTFFPLIIMFSVPIESLSVGVILLFNVAFALGAVFFDWKFAFLRNARKGDSIAGFYNSAFLKTAFFGMTISSIAFLTINSLYQEITIYDMIFNLMESAARYTELRYSDEIIINIFGQLSIVFSYVGASVGGFLLYCSGKRSHRAGIIFLSLLPAIVVAITQGNKGQLPLAIVLLFAGFLVCKVSENRLEFTLGRSIKTAMLYVLPVVAVFTVSSLLSRGLFKEEDPGFVLETMKYYFNSYFFGHLYAFSDWFSHSIGNLSILSYDEETMSYGYYTFMSLFKLFGSDKITPMGVFDEYFAYDNLLMTNIYTMFRGLILDFGVTGTLVYMLVTSVLLHLSFFIMLHNRIPVFSVAVFVFMVGYFFSSFLISMLMYNSIYVSLVFMCLLLFVNKTIYRNSSKEIAAGFAS